MKISGKKDTMAETIIVGAIIVAAAAYTLYRLVYKRSCGCGDGCSCSNKAPADLRSGCNCESEGGNSSRKFSCEGSKGWGGAK